MIRSLPAPAVPGMNISCWTHSALPWIHRCSQRTREPFVLPTGVDQLSHLKTAPLYFRRASSRNNKLRLETALRTAPLFELALVGRHIVNHLLPLQQLTYLHTYPLATANSFALRINDQDGHVHRGPGQDRPVLLRSPRGSCMLRYQATLRSIPDLEC